MAQTLDAIGTKALPSILNGSRGQGTNYSQTNSASHSFTNGTGATIASNLQAAMANTSAWDAWEAAAEYNAKEAQKNRDWQEHMANTQYQRAVKDMIAAGINPILAASYGISGAGVGSGATASMSAPEVFMGHSFADTTSASNANGYGYGWNESESGVATALSNAGRMLSNALDTVTSAKATQQAMAELKASTSKDKDKDTKEWVDDLVKALESSIVMQPVKSGALAWP